MPMTSYAQNAEDVLLNRLFPGIDDGFYVDVGANHPTLHSVTRHFYDRGWSGVNVEPVPRVCDLLRADRPRDVNLALALSDRPGTMTLHEPIDSLGMSTLNPDFAAGLRAHGYAYERRTVDVITLADLCEQHVGDRTIEFLKIDVEGHETAVIRGADWRRWRPRAVVVEASIEVDQWEPLLLGADYTFAAFDGLNRYYLRSEDARLLPLLEAPANVLDDYVSHEQLLAVDGLRRQRDEALARLAEFEAIGPSALSLARRLRAASRRVPFASSFARRMRRIAG
jgi:FkbM family methyltransferase